MVDIKEICRKAKHASRASQGYTGEQKNEILSAIASALRSEANLKRLADANALDIENAGRNGKDAVFIDRLTLNEKRIASMTEGLRQVAALPDPVGEITEDRTLANGLHITRVRAPLGVIGIIYEARPNVTVDAAALCLKSGNAVVLRGGKDALNSNRVLYEIMRGAISAAGYDEDAVGFIDDPSREASREMLRQGEYIDVMIPRGGEGLKKFVLENATMPVIASAGGNCHTYVEKTARQDMAIRVIVNAKVQRPSVCNALEHVIVDRAIAKEFLPALYAALRENGVTVLGTEEVRKILPEVGLATDEDFYTEFLAYKLTIMLVDGVREAVDFINSHSTAHSDAILTEDSAAARYFATMVDSAAVYINASTRFTDGFEFGLGAEMGISTQKLHARGPIALRELTSTKYVITGDGQIRK